MAISPETKELYSDMRQRLEHFSLSGGVFPPLLPSSVTTDGPLLINLQQISRVKMGIIVF